MALHMSEEETSRRRTLLRFGGASPPRGDFLRAWANWFTPYGGFFLFLPP